MYICIIHTPVTYYSGNWSPRVSSDTPRRLQQAAADNIPRIVDRAEASQSLACDFGPYTLSPKP